MFSVFELSGTARTIIVVSISVNRFGKIFYPSFPSVGVYIYTAEVTFFFSRFVRGIREVKV